MPAVSKQQYKFLKAVEEGYVKAPGLSKEKAKEMTDKNKGKYKFSKLREYVKKKK